jgi:hypothetical protein
MQLLSDCRDQWSEVLRKKRCAVRLIEFSASYFIFKPRRIMAVPLSNEADRVRAHTAPELLAQIDERIEAQIQFYATQSKGAISMRIEELEREWDIERLLQTNASALAFTGLVLGTTVNKKWLLLTGGVLAFLFQHAIQGWCPPIPLLRRLGVRTRGEIDREKFALKALRGDFENIPVKAENNPMARAHDVLLAVNS